MKHHEYLPTTQAAAYAGISRRSLYRKAKPIQGGHGRVESLWRVSDLDALRTAKAKRQGGGQ